jgi:hypothetical protein
MDKKQSLPVKIKIILYVDQISWGREPSDQCPKSTPKKKKKKKSKKASCALCERRRQEERERVCVCVSRLELHFRQNFRCGTDLVSSLKRREKERAESAQKERKEKKKTEVRRALICKRRRKRKGAKKGMRSSTPDAKPLWYLIKMRHDCREAKQWPPSFSPSFLPSLPSSRNTSYLVGRSWSDVLHCASNEEDTFERMIGERSES